ncbi:hypothetical protein [Mycoplasma sp. CB776]
MKKIETIFLIPYLKMDISLKILNYEQADELESYLIFALINKDYFIKKFPEQIDEFTSIKDFYCFVFGLKNNNFILIEEYIKKMMMNRIIYNSKTTEKYQKMDDIELEDSLDWILRFSFIDNKIIENFNKEQFTILNEVQSIEKKYFLFSLSKKFDDILENIKNHKYKDEEIKIEEKEEITKSLIDKNFASTIFEKNNINSIEKEIENYIIPELNKKSQRIKDLIINQEDFKIVNKIEKVLFSENMDVERKIINIFPQDTYNYELWLKIFQTYKENYLKKELKNLLNYKFVKKVDENEEIENESKNPEYKFEKYFLNSENTVFNYSKEEVQKELSQPKLSIPNYEDLKIFNNKLYEMKKINYKLKIEDFSEEFQIQVIERKRLNEEFFLRENEIFFEQLKKKTSYSQFIEEFKKLFNPPNKNKNKNKKNKKGKK